MIYRRYLSPRGQTIEKGIGKVAGILSEPTTTPTPTPTPTVIPYTISLIHVPKEIMEGDTTTFTWRISGPLKTIHTSAIYYGTKSDSGAFTKNASPDDTLYTGVVEEFIKGNYTVPIQFVGNTKYTKPGTYFFRGYALIDGKHYWTEERSLIVKPIPKHEIKIDNPPTNLSAGASTAFTWDIYGPSATTGFTAIVAAKESKPGPLDNSVDISMTPYKVIVSEFTTGKYDVPLRFVGNVALSESGVYYFRAIAFINDKNIWSEEYSFTVQ
ncbi:hypothetical protein HY407_04160 [Candidatus Gottesmanbacteria bacterium]|nr:hypothetical protein [Candidatus Gottesmanbacteria bacterium]